MTKSRFASDRMVPISYNEKEDFENIDPEYFFLCKIISGYVVLKINGQIFHIHSNSLLSFPHKTEIEVLALCDLQAVSVSFAPEFINLDINWKLIESVDYPSSVGKYNFPEFDLFYKRNTLYGGILPLDDKTGIGINNIFKDIVVQLKDQPTGKWSCTARSDILTIFKITEYFCREFMKGGEQYNTLEKQVIGYITNHFREKITIDELCKIFCTNRTTLSENFKVWTNETIDGYIMRKRIELAECFLAFTELSVESISEKCGYKDHTYFSRLFKRRHGMPPLKYRYAMQDSRPTKKTC